MKVNSMSKYKIVIATMLSVLLMFCAASALQKTPYHDQTEGVNIWSYSSFTPYTAADGKYGTKKGKYIEQCWVKVKAGNKLYSDYSQAFNKNDSGFGEAEIKVFNNPFTNQSFSHGWSYN